MNKRTTTCASQAQENTSSGPPRSSCAATRGPIEIASLAIASTAHVAKREAELLDAADYARGEYGWLIYVGQHGYPVVPEIDTLSEGLAAVVARARDCTYLLLDRDADVVEGAPTYDW